MRHFNIQLLFDRPFSGSQPRQISKRGFDGGHLGGGKLLLQQDDSVFNATA
jgi:hypothetical protein